MRKKNVDDYGIEKAKSEALKLTLIKRRTAKQISARLAEKGFPEGVISEAVDYYIELGYIDDRDYAHRYTHDAIENKGFGEFRIRKELALKGVSEDIIDECLDGCTYDLKGLMMKKFPKCEDKKDLQKVLNHFLRKGFSHDEISSTIRELYSV